jgi:SAM-dependent methyltransferase
MCGTGETTAYLLARGARVVGLDISEQEIALFRQRWPTCSALCGSIFATGLPAASFDAVVTVCGLHHLHPRIEDAVCEIGRLLRPGGHFCFVEPHAGSLPDIARRTWYRLDPMFAANEGSVDTRPLRRRFAAEFEFISQEYGGSFGYLLVLNSLIFRLPLRLKKHYSPVCFWLEAAAGRIQGPRCSCFVVEQWRKR